MKSDSKKLHIQLYKTMYLIRSAEQEIARHYRDDGMKTPMHMSMGQEAIVAGVIEAAGKTAQVFGTYRSHALYLAKTGETDMFFAEMYGKATGPAKGKAGSMHISLPESGMVMTSAVVATTIPVAVGAALANKYLGNNKLVVSFFGDGAIHEGVFWESLNFACLKKLPILFVCEDNNLAIHSHLQERTGHKDITKVISQFYCHIDKAETTDAYRIHQMVTKMLASMKKSGMPGFLHLKYFRYLEHVGIGEDFDAGYRFKKDLPKGLKTDPVIAQRKRLLQLGIKEEKITALEQEISGQVAKGRAKAAGDPFPKLIETFTDLYA